MIPLEQESKQEYFVLSRFPFQSCFFCGGARPETVVEVFLEDRFTFVDDRIKVTGILELNEDDPLQLFYVLRNSTITNIKMDKTSFFQDVFEVAKLIPKGRVTSYGGIAKYLGLKSSARMVGWAMNQAHLDPDIPAQRVVNRSGLLTGKHHFATENRMQELLEADGVMVKNDKVVDFEKIYWDPIKELGI